MKDLCRRLFAKIKSPAFLFFALAVVVMTVQMVIASHKLAEQAFYPMPSFRMLAQNHLCDVLFLASFYWLLPSRRKGWLWLLITVVTVWCFANITYNETYHDMMPFGSWLYFSNLGGLLFDSILGTITCQSVAVLVLPIVLLAVYFIWLRKRISRDTLFGNWRQRFMAALATLMLSMLLWFALLSIRAHHKSQSIKECFVEKYCSIVNFRLKVYPVSNGNVPFVIYSIVKALDGVTAEQKEQAGLFIKNEVPAYTDNPYCTVHSRNVILLMVESLNAWVVDMKIDGREVCPVLNSLVADSASISCTQMMAQVKNGRSSDGMFIYNTGLLPLTGGSVAMDFGGNEYPAFAKALKGIDRRYCAMEFTVDRAGMWNVETTARSYGFDSLYLQDAYLDEYIKSGQSIDKTLLEFAARKLSAHKGPFYSMIFTGTTHIPYDKLEGVEPTWISKSRSYTVNVRNYLEKVAFFDRQLGAFIDSLKENGVYDNTVLVIASDHSDFVDDDPLGRASISKRGIECLFVILNSGLQGQLIKGPVGQVDIYPTLLDIMGANSYWWKGLGYSLLRNNVNSTVPAPSEKAGDTSSSLFSHQRQAWPTSEILIKTNWWKK